VLAGIAQVGPYPFVLAGANYARQHGKRGVPAQIISGLVLLEGPYPITASSDYMSTETNNMMSRDLLPHVIRLRYIQPHPIILCNVEGLQTELFIK